MTINSNNFCVIGWECPAQWEKNDILNALDENWDNGYTENLFSQERHESWFELTNSKFTHSSGFTVIERSQHNGAGHIIGVNLIDYEQDIDKSLFYKQFLSVYHSLHLLEALIQDNVDSKIFFAYEDINIIRGQFR